MKYGYTLTITRYYDSDEEQGGTDRRTLRGGVIEDVVFEKNKHIIRVSEREKSRETI